ncbi:MAG: OmpA family protein [Chitinispirillaceae bacterium]|nr:OmpA family protein [Chitinispirillaceae bacterium]
MNKARKSRSAIGAAFLWCALLTMAGISSGADEACGERPMVNQNGQRGLSSLTSAHTLGVGRVALGIYSNGALDQSYLRERATFHRIDSVFVADTPKPQISTFNIYPFIGAGIANFFDVSLMLPLHLDYVGRYQEVGLGDMRVSLKFNALSGFRSPVFDMGFLAVLELATGNLENGFFPRHLYYFNKDSLNAYFNKDSLNTDSCNATTEAFYTAVNPGFETRMLLTLDLSALKRSIPLALHLDYGLHFSTLPATDHALLINGGLEYHPVRSFALIAELASEMRLHNLSHGFKLNRDPFRLSPAFAVTPRNGFMLTAGVDLSLSAPSTTFTYLKAGERYPQRISSGIEPKWRAFVRIGWNGILIDRDQDGDGIFDRRDACLSQKEDIDGFNDDDGCPDIDNDGDDIPDSLDKCPNEPEDFDKFEDEDGCPDIDNDGDMIPDSLDKCPNEPEDHDGFQDKDGCPDIDNDGDMVPDSLDKCPDLPEDHDGFEDKDGCPDIDNDQDGVPDSLDKCPDQVGPPENGGCAISESPKKKSRGREIKRGRVILRGISFEPERATIDPTSYIILDEVVASLVDWPEVKIEIQGHVDKSGKKQDKTLLSQARAETVRNYLINRGISPHRLTAVGRGSGDPIADNTSAAGRAMNNRIEIRRTDP